MVELQICMNVDNAFAVAVIARIKMNDGDEFFVCDAWDALKDALSGDEHFVGHKIVGMAPVEVIINPKYVTRVERIEEGD
jgi:hypothetical protein